MLDNPKLRSVQMNQQQGPPWLSYASQGGESIDLTQYQPSIPQRLPHPSPSPPLVTPRSDMEQLSHNLLPYLQNMAAGANAESAQQQLRILQAAQTMGLRLQPSAFQPGSQLPVNLIGTPQAAQAKQKKGVSRKQLSRTAPRPRKELKRIYAEDEGGTCLRFTRPDHFCFTSTAPQCWLVLAPASSLDAQSHMNRAHLEQLA